MFQGNGQYDYLIACAFVNLATVANVRGGYVDRLVDYSERLVDYGDALLGSEDFALSLCFKTLADSDLVECLQSPKVLVSGVAVLLLECCCLTLYFVCCTAV